MGNILYESTEATISYIKKEAIIQLTWKKQTNDREYRQVFTEIVKFAGNKKVNGFISDMRNEGLIPVESIKWLQTEIIPMSDKLGGSKIALVFNDDLYKQIYAESIRKSFEPHNVKVEIFSDYSKALLWLKEK